MAAGGARCPLTWEGWGEAALCEEVFQSFCKQAVCVSLTLQAGLTNWDEPQQLCEGWLCTHRGLSWFILMFGWILHILGPFCNLFTSFFFKVAAWLLQFIMNASHFTSGSSDGRNSRSPGGQRHYFPLVFLSFQHIFVTLKKHEFWIWCTLIDFTLNKSNCPSTFFFSLPLPLLRFFPLSLCFESDVFTRLHVGALAKPMTLSRLTVISHCSHFPYPPSWTLDSEWEWSRSTGLVIFQWCAPCQSKRGGWWSTYFETTV